MTRVIAMAVLAAAFLAAAEARAACTLMAVPKADGAQVKVYFTKFIKEDNTGGKYKACKLVTKADKDTTTFFVTPFRQDATAIVHRDNWPQ